MALFSFIRRVDKPKRRRDDGEWRLRELAPIKAERELYDELEFLHLLYIERRRCERFSRPLCLIVVEQTGPLDSATQCGAFRQIVDQMHGAIRETDIVGWYSQNSKLAIMFPDLASTDTAITGVLGAKVSKAVSVALPAQIVVDIRLTVHLFPTMNGPETHVRDLTFYPELSGQSKMQRTARMLKQLIDVGGSVILLCLLAPLFALIAAAIKANSAGPIIFKQVRVGQYGRPFNFLKFRSMYMGSDTAIHRKYATTFISGEATATDGIYKITNDLRVTAVGRFLRKTSLDELPQLWNVLCGDMSLVGPRPPIPYECDCYALWHRRRIMEAKPGITGLWQVMGRSRLEFNDMVRLDLNYAKHWSLWLDIKILLQTPKAVLMGEGAY